MTPGRKQLPHDVPRWLLDPSTEVYFLTICAKDRADFLVRGDTPTKLLDSIQFYNQAKKWRVNLAVINILNNPVRAGLVEDWQNWPHQWIAQRPV